MANGRIGSEKGREKGQTPPQLCLGKTAESQTRCSQLSGQSRERARGKGGEGRSVSLDKAQSRSSSSQPVRSWLGQSTADGDV